jgi:ubiquinone/menaquinone biosynthesis C-methylase UbiE
LTEFPEGELPRRVLDIGCGTGIWMYDVAKQWRERGHNDVEFVGVDLVPVQTPMVLLFPKKVDEAGSECQVSSFEYFDG